MSRPDDQNPGEPGEAIAIVGMVGRFPGARNLEEFWRNLEKGVDSISHFEHHELEPSRLELQGTQSLPNYVKARGILEHADKFDAAFFGLTPREASAMDPQHRLFLEAAWEALEHAGYDSASFSGLIGVWAGMSNATYYFENILPRPDILAQIGPFQAMLANEKDYLATRVSYKLNLRGPSVNVYTACSTSLTAVCMAGQALLSYQCDMALAGGISITVPQRKGYLYQEGAIGSPDGRCRPFDAAAAGTVFSDGLGIVVLKRLSEALEDGDTIHAVIRGAALNNDGSGKISFTAPSVDGQAEVIATAQALAGVDPRTISYVEAHGTATPLGDPIEIAALTQAFRAATSARGFCAIGSVKSNIGHLDAAAGVAGLIKTVLALRNRQLPPTAHFTRPNPQIDFENGPFFVNAELCPWLPGDTPRRAGVSSFGIGGTNVHVVLEEAPARPASETSRADQVLVLSAKTERALDVAAANLAHHLRDCPASELADLAHTLQIGRRAFAFRRAIVCRDPREAAEALERHDPKRVLSGVGERSAAMGVVFLFPGQGAQHLGMARGLYESEPAFRREFDACADAFLPHLSVDIRSVVFATPPSRETAARQLAETALTQPALFALEYALARHWETWGITPAAMIGHSLGEYVAACLAGVFSREDAIALVAARGRLMQLQPRGAMMAVRLSSADLGPRLGTEVAVAGLNAPELTVVSGPEAAIRELESKLGERGVGCKVLATSHAFHSPMMDGALAPFREALSGIRLASPGRPWISCVTGDWISPTQATDPEYWVQQLRQPVRFSDGVRQLAKTPNHALLEVGPGHTLSTLVRQHRGRPTEQSVIASLGTDPGQDVPALLEALGRLWIAGVKPDWPSVHREARRRIPLPTYPFERTRLWVEPPPLEGQLLIGGPASRTASTRDAVDAPSDHSGLAAPAPPVGAASTGIERRLRSVLSRASGIPGAEIDPSASFVELGFDSLLLTQVSSALEDTFGLKVTFRQLLENLSTPKALIDHLEVSLAGDAASATARTDATPAGARPSSLDAARPAGPEPAQSKAAKSVPLSEAQREIWAVAQLGPDASCVFNLCSALRLTGRVAVEALRGAVQQLFQRHEALRMLFDPSGDVQTVAPLGPVEVPIVDLSSLPARDRASRLEETLTGEVATAFDLVGGPPARARIVIESADSCVLALTAHHIVCDGWSLWLLFQELSSLYDAARGGDHAWLAPAVPFSRFLQRETEGERQVQAQAALEHWLTVFRGQPPALDLPLDYPRPKLKTYRGGREAMRIDAALAAGVKRSAALHGSTFVGFLLAVFQVLLHRLSGQSDVVVGVPASVRSADDSRSLVGHATNLLPVRVEVERVAPFSDHLARVKRALLDAHEHQALTFGTLVRALAPQRDPSRTPLVTVTFNVGNGRVPRGFADAEAEVFAVPRRQVHFELEMNLLDTDDGFVAECSYNPDLFAADTVRRWLRHYTALLAGAVADPAAPLDRLPLLTKADRAEQVRWNETAVEFSRGCVHELVSEQARRTPGRVAVRFGGESLRYGDLEERSERLARRLRGQGVAPGVRVGVYLERSPDMIVGVLGVLKAGGAYVPLDPAFPSERLSYMLEDSGSAILLTDAATAVEPLSRAVAVVQVGEEGGMEAPLGETRACPEDLAYVIYTSGSTGLPKGVGVTHRSLVNLLESMGREPGLGEADVLLSVTTLSFDIAALELYLPLIKGGRIELASREEALDGLRLIERLASSGVSVLQATPATWRILLESGWKGTAGLKVLCGGEALSRDLAEELLPRADEVWNVYGPTETTVWSSACRVESGTGPISIGRPIANTQMWILDAHLEPQPVGVPGELYIGGAGVARGYWERPELTAERFVPDPFSEGPAARLYRTGDLAKWLPDGRLECLGRIDHQVKVRGFRIELGEIEAALQECTGIEQAVVVAQDGAAGDRRLAAFLRHGSSAVVSVANLRAHLASRLPQYMLPSTFLFLDSLPLTPNGKVDRKALARMEGGAALPRQEQVPPRTPTEERIASIWVQKLEISSVGVHDDFFAVGGNSLNAARIIAQLRSVFGVDVGLRNLFERPTVAGLAEVVDMLVLSSIPHGSEVAMADREEYEV